MRGWPGADGRLLPRLRSSRGRQQRPLRRWAARGSAWLGAGSAARPAECGPAASAPCRRRATRRRGRRNAQPLGAALGWLPSTWAAAAAWARWWTTRWRRLPAWGGDQPCRLSGAAAASATSRRPAWAWRLTSRRLRPLPRPGHGLLDRPPQEADSAGNLLEHPEVQQEHPSLPHRALPRQAHGALLPGDVHGLRERRPHHC